MTPGVRRPSRHNMGVREWAVAGACRQSGARRDQRPWPGRKVRRAHTRSWTPTVRRPAAAGPSAACTPTTPTRPQPRRRRPDPRRRQQLRADLHRARQLLPGDLPLHGSPDSQIEIRPKPFPGDGGEDDFSAAEQPAAQVSLLTTTPATSASVMCPGAGDKGSCVLGEGGPEHVAGPPASFRSRSVASDHQVTVRAPDAPPVPRSRSRTHARSGGTPPPTLPGLHRRPPPQYHGDGCGTPATRSRTEPRRSHRTSPGEVRKHP